MENEPNSDFPNGEMPISADVNKLYSVRTWVALLAMLTVFLSLCPLNVIIPVIFYFCSKDATPGAVPFIKRVLNFQISWTLWGLVSFIIICLFGVMTFNFLQTASENQNGDMTAYPVVLVLALFVILLAFIYVIVWIVFSILMLVRANTRPEYIPPLTVCFFKN